MMNDERQAQLLEGYLLALRADAGAPPPPGLDPDLAAFARELASTAAPTPDAATRERVWQRALEAADTGCARINGHHRTTRYQEKTTMIATQHAPVAPKSAQPLTLIAALAVVALAALLLFARPPAEPDDMPALLSNNEQQEATPTPAVSPTFVPTSTPFPMESIVPTATPLPASIVPGMADDPCIEWRLTPENMLIPTIDAPYLTVPQQNPTVVPGRSDAVQVEAQPTIDAPYLTVPRQNPTPVPGISQEVRVEPIPATPTPVPGVSGDPCIEWQPTIMPPMMIPTDGEPIAYGDTVEGQLAAGNPVAYYRFEANEGDVVTLRVVGENGLDTRVALSHEAGYFISDDDSGPGLDPELYRQRLPLSGAYGIAVEAASGESGRFTLTLELDE